ncbi:hypothetical protein DCC62_23980 [candidate division KSB1 bacterium]|nr:MAG: hypothetical protein DCC62_23980 [candidate division KSB1 bacterium]
MIPRICALDSGNELHKLKHTFDAFCRSQFKETADLGFHRFMFEAVKYLRLLGHILFLPNSKFI